MHLIKQFNLILFSMILFLACTPSKETEIAGTLTGAENMTIYLDNVTLTQQSNILLQATIGADGKFKLSLPDGLKKGIYRLRIGEQIADIISDGSEKTINITGKLADLNEFGYKLTGSPLTENYIQTVRSYIEQKMDVPALTTYTAKTAEPLVAYQLAVRLFTLRPEFLDLHKEVSARLTAQDPSSSIASEYSMIISQIEQQVTMETAAAKIKVGEPAPEIALPGPDGKIRKLSSYKGKVVLIDFWASWCGPCRKENPHVVEVYHKYKKKGFEIFSVSLDGIDSRTAQRFTDPAQLKEQTDATKARWIGAIEQDQLAWDGHVSDLKKWECAPAGIYGVRSIPQTFLVGRDGNIVAINPRTNLEEQLQKFL
jgi:thiol-disulfide isomerase/thioredoxin